MGRSEQEQLKKNAEQEIIIESREEQHEGQAMSPVTFQGMLQQNAPVIHQGRIFDVEKNRAFLQGVSDRAMLARAEGKAAGKPVMDFKMKSKHLKGVSQRKRDTATAEEIRKNYGDNQDINYRSYRIYQGWSSREDVQVNEYVQDQIMDAVEAAHKWKLSWNMLQPNVLADCVLQVRQFYRQARLLIRTMKDPLFAELYGSMPEDRYELLSQIVKCAEPLVAGVEITFSGMGLSIDEEGGISYKNTALTAEQKQKNQNALKKLKSRFTNRRKTLNSMDESLIKHYTSMSANSATSLAPQIYQSGKNATTVLIDNAEKCGSIKELDALFGKESTLDAGFRKEYDDLMTKIMERDDVSFEAKENKWLDQIYKLIGDRIRYEMNYDNSSNFYKKPERYEEIFARRKESFDAFCLPYFKDVVRLVNEGKVGKDTAKLFLSPAAMNLTVKGLEMDMYKTLAMRPADKQITSPKNVDAAYKDEVIDLVKGLRHDADRIHVQGGQVIYFGGGRFDNDECTPEKLKKMDKFIIFDKKDPKSGDEGDPNSGSGSDAESENDMRCYVTVREDRQKEMVAHLHGFLDENPKFKGAFTFKLLSASNDHKLDNIVIYLNSNDTDPELLKEFINGFYDRIKDIVTDDDKVPTGYLVKKGIVLSAEPKKAYTHAFRMGRGFNPFGEGKFRVGEPIRYKSRGIKKKKGDPDCELQTVKKYTEKVKTNAQPTAPREEVLESGKNKQSWNQYCSRLLILSAYVARHRLNRSANDSSISKDPQVIKEMKQVFQEFMILSGVDPETLMLYSSGDFLKKISG